MSPDEVFESLKVCLYYGILVSSPVVVTAMVVGITVGLLQTVTSVQEQTLSFVPKLIAAAACFWLLGMWMLHELANLFMFFFQQAGSVS